MMVQRGRGRGRASLVVSLAAKRTYQTVGVNSDFLDDRRDVSLSPSVGGITSIVVASGNESVASGVTEDDGRMAEEKGWWCEILNDTEENIVGDVVVPYDSDRKVSTAPNIDRDGPYAFINFFSTLR